jgi:hypothetical protein
MGDFTGDQQHAASAGGGTSARAGRAIMGGGIRACDAGGDVDSGAICGWFVAECDIGVSAIVGVVLRVVVETLGWVRRGISGHGILRLCSASTHFAQDDRWGS